MISIEKVRALALEFAEAIEEPHFEKTSFRVRKKIFATLDTAKQHVVLKLTEMDQSLFTDFDEAIYPVPGAWGKKGWTRVEMAKVEEEIFIDALTIAYKTVAPKKLANTYTSRLKDS